MATAGYNGGPEKFPPRAAVSYTSKTLETPSFSTCSIITPGYPRGSRFDYVRAYRVNHLKIAQSFINRSTTDAESAATIRAIVNFARDIGIVVIAQGVETEQQRDLLTLTDITTQAQGFHFSKPVGAKRASELLRKGSVALADESSTKEQLRPEPRGALSARS